MASSYLYYFTIVLVVAIPQIYSRHIGAISASSSFSIQHIEDGLGDWLQPTFQIVKNSKGNPVSDNNVYNDINKSVCMNSMNLTSLPDMSGVSYSSDGETLKSTFWFNKPIIIPSINNATFVKVEAVNLSDSKQASYFVSTHKNLDPNIEKIIRQPEQRIEGFNKSYTQGSLHNISEAYILDKPPGLDRLYLITFNTPAESLDDYGSFFSKMKGSFRSWNSTNATQQHFIPHNDSKAGFLIDYPETWKDITQKNATISTVVFSPPQWVQMVFENAINVPSIYESQPDYISSIHWDQPDNWTQVLKLVSPHEPNETPDQKTLVNHAEHLKVEDPGNRSLDMSLELSTVGYPSSFTILSSFNGIFETYYKGNSVRCSVIDISSWAQLPPPKTTLMLIPNSLKLVPGEEKSIQLEVNCSTDLDSNITLSPNPIDNVNITISPNHLYLGPHEISSSTVHLTSTMPFDALDYIRTKSIGSRDKILQIDADDALPITAVAGNLSYTNKAGQLIHLPKAFASITLENPEPLPDQFKDMLQSSAVSASEMSGLLTAIIGIAASSSIIGRRLLNKKKKNKLKKEKHSKSRSDSPF